MSNAYTEIYDQSINDPNGFWGKIAEDCYWHKKWDKVLDDSNTPFYRWFTGGEVNTCYNAIDFHIENGRGDQDAIIYDSPVTDTIRKYTYSELKEHVAKFAGVLASRGVGKKDRVIIYMPMIPEAVFAMLACARLGAVHSVVFGGFAANELATRINDAKPKVIVSASCGIEVKKIIEYKPLLDEALALSDAKPESCVIFQRPMAQATMVDGRDFDWEESMASASAHDCVPVNATDPLYILYTSGTTGQPKGVVRDNGGHMVALKWTMGSIYGVDAGDVYWAASDIGWVVGHSYIAYGPLLKGCTTIIFEGKPVGTPDASVFWRIISDHKVKALFTAPTAFRAIKREDPDAQMMKNFDLSGFKYLFLAGERLDPDTLAWAKKALDIPVIDHWWQTETGWAIAANCMGIHQFDVKPGSPTKPVPGWHMDVLGDDGHPVNPGDIGAIVAKLPLPPGTLPTLWQNDQRFQNTYLSEFPGYYETADAGFIDEDGYIFVMARTDDIINVAGHRLSTGAMEEAIAEHPDVAECAVMGVEDPLKGQIPLGMMVLNAGVDRDHDDVVKEVIALVRNKIGPVAAFKTAVVVKRLPKTRSGKILRGTMRSIADKKEYRVPATIDDPSILEEIEVSLGKIGYGKNV